MGGDEKAIETLEYSLLAAGLGKSRKVCASLSKRAATRWPSKSWNTGHWQLGSASLGKSRQVRGDEKAIEMVEYKHLAAGLGRSRQV